MLVGPLAMVTLVKLLQPTNAYCPMLVTLPGIVTFFRLLQLAKSPSVIAATQLSKVTLV